MLPNFFVVGAQKAGTTTLHHLLSGHPEIYLPEQKETKFFARESDWDKGQDYYESQYFSAVSDQKAVGEIDPDYMYYEAAIGRMQQVYGSLDNLKFIFVLRNPIERAFSHYLMTSRRGHEVLSFEKAISQESVRVKDDYLSRQHFSYVDRGFYFRQISRFLEHVSPDKVLILFTEDLNGDELGEVKRVCEFLEIDTDFVPENLKQRFNSASKPKFLYMRKFLDKNGFLKNLFRALFPFVKTRRKFKEKLLKWNEKGQFKSVPKMSAETRTTLKTVFDPDIKQLEVLCQRDLSGWK